MKTQGIAMLVYAMCRGGLSAAQATPSAGTMVAVCMDFTPQVMVGVQPAVSAMFARIGVRINWRDASYCQAISGSVQVHLSHERPTEGASADALAYARLNERTVVVFLQRVDRFDRSQIRMVITHVLVHEITHVLEGVSRHSTTGVMKAHWNKDDYFAMRRTLAFAQEDVDLIRARLSGAGQ
jgi:hypothetical protein